MFSVEKIYNYLGFELPRSLSLQEENLEHCTPREAICELPEEVILHIFSYLTVRDLTSAAFVNRKFYALSQSSYGLDHIFQACISERFPHTSQEGWVQNFAVDNGWRTTCKLICLRPSKETHLFKFKEGLTFESAHAALEGDNFVVSERTQFHVYSVLGQNLKYSKSHPKVENCDFENGVCHLQGGMLVQTFKIVKNKPHKLWGVTLFSEKESSHWAINAFDVGTGELIYDFDKYQQMFPMVCALRDGILATSFDSSVCLWNLKEKPGMVRTLKAHGDGAPVTCLAIGGGVLATGSRHKKVKIWSIETGQLLYRLQFKCSITALLLSETELFVAATSFKRNGSVRLTKMGNKAVYAYSWPKEKWASPDGWTRLPNTEFQEKIEKILYQEGIIILAGSYDKNSYSQPSNVAVLDVKEQKWIRRGYTASPSSVAFQGQVAVWLERNELSGHGFRFAHIRNPKVFSCNTGSL